MAATSVTTTGWYGSSAAESAETVFAYGSLGVISDPTAVFFLLAACVAVALLLEARTKIFGALGSALLGILLGTGTLIARPDVTAAAAVVYLAGTVIRIRAEERLLRERFGAAAVEYARRVPALWPRWGGSGA